MRKNDSERGHDRPFHDGPHAELVSDDNLTTEGQATQGEGPVVKGLGFR
jgi:hypothetical protein